MLSLVSRCSPRFHSSYTPIACIPILLVSRFCISHRRPSASSAASTTNPSQDDIKRKSRNEAFKARYANDPEHREKIKAQQLARANTRYANDPGYRANYLARQNAVRNARYINDPEYRARTIAQVTAWHRARCASDPTYRAAILAKSSAQYKSDAQKRKTRRAAVAASMAKLSLAAREKYRQQNSLAKLQQYHNDFISKQRVNLRAWICRKVSKQELMWRTHEVELNANEVTHTCSGPKCGYEKKLKLWMRRKGSDPALYDCFKCFTSDWVPEKVLPIGYEHKVWGAS
ncbi:hypothetical protein KCU95_g14694, partial [Aureobasidium melanogenum]